MDDDQPRVPRLRLVADNPATPASRPRSPRRTRAMQARMNTIADLVGVPVTTFLDESAARARRADPAEGPPTEGEVAELQALFRQVRDPDLRRHCLAFLRARVRPPGS